MIEKTDGTFGDIKPIPNLMAELSLQETLNDIKAIHVGTEEELIAIKEKKTLEHRMDEVEKNLNKIMIHLGIDDKTKVLEI
jgi:predicted secreted acid phosphatase